MSEKKNLRLCFVCPRYRTENAGGAEILTEKLAERLAAEGHYTEVFTTCARDHFTWKNYYPAGVFNDGRIQINRFRVNENRNTINFLRIQKKIDLGLDISRNEEESWIQGSVHSDDLYQAIEDRFGDFDYFVFAPYLFGITYNGCLLAGEKSLLIPCLHDEPFAYLSIFNDLFKKVSGVLFNAYPEWDLAQRLYDIEKKKCALVGMGFDEHPSSKPDQFRKKYGLEGKPFMLYAGRREQGKNTPLLMEYIQAFNSNNEQDLRLLLIGTGEVIVPAGAEDAVLDLGFLSIDEKNSAYEAADMFCQPSVNESLSIVIMESWLAGTPVLVNGKCDVTRYHCEKSNGGLFFNSYYEFEECVKLLLDNAILRGKLAENGKAYVEKEYTWGRVIASFEKLIAKISEE